MLTKGKALMHAIEQGSPEPTNAAQAAELAKQANGGARRCNHDGGTCHHHCDGGECFRKGFCLPLTEPWEGFQKTGKYEAKVESLRTVSIEWSGAIFDTEQQAKNWAAKIKRSWINDGVDPAAIRTAAYRTAHDDSARAEGRQG